MRDDDEHGRFFVPVLRRIILLVAVIAAVPVALWSITTFVRSYVAPPQLPTFRPLAATAANDPATTTGTVQDVANRALRVALQDKSNPSVSALVDARATATDSRDPIVDIGNSNPGRQSSDGSAAPVSPKMAIVTPSPQAQPKPVPPAAALSASAAPTASDRPDRVATSAALGGTSPWPDPTPTSGALPAPPPAAADSSADQLPPGVPIVGRVPLPTRRPRIAALAGAAVPVPRPRPTAAPETAPAMAEESPFSRGHDPGMR
jgi:hypothetical protein